MANESSPLYEALKYYNQTQRARFHMPGHKGRENEALFGDVLRFDVTEIPLTDTLYSPMGAIQKLEENAQNLYGTAQTLLSAGGSTLCIQTMLALVQAKGKTVILPRNAHVAVINAMALLDLNPCYLPVSYDAQTGFLLPPTAQQVKQALQNTSDAACVWITSPDYFGVMADIAAIAAVCRGFGVPLLVDNAHGAHLAFVNKPCHPIQLGASMCCDSLHKTLPALTGAALLHIGDAGFCAQAKQMMSLFGSTSPSFLIMLSADRCLARLQKTGRQEISKLQEQVSAVLDIAHSRGIRTPQGITDPCRVSLNMASIGLSGAGIRAHFEEYGIECEYIDPQNAVCLPSICSTDADFQRLLAAIQNIPSQQNRMRQVFAMPFAQRAPRLQISLRQAALAPQQMVPTQDALGRIAGAPTIACPPGVAIVMPGEEIDSEGIKYLLRYGIKRVSVLK